MTALLLYAYCHGVYSSRRIGKAARERVDFTSIVGVDPPDFRTVSDFRKRHLKALAGLFAQVLKLCEQAGLVKLGHVALDGISETPYLPERVGLPYRLQGCRVDDIGASVGCRRDSRGCRDLWARGVARGDAQKYENRRRTAGRGG